MSSLKLYDSTPPTRVGKCYACETWEKDVVLKEFVVEVPSDEDGAQEVVVELPVCADPEKCERNASRRIACRPSKF